METTCSSHKLNGDLSIYPTVLTVIGMCTHDHNRQYSLSLGPSPYCMVRRHSPTMLKLVIQNLHKQCKQLCIQWWELQQCLTHPTHIEHRQSCHLQLSRKESTLPVLMVNTAHTLGVVLYMHMLLPPPPPPRNGDNLCIHKMPPSQAFHCASTWLHLEQLAACLCQCEGLHPLGMAAACLCECEGLHPLGYVWSSAWLWLRWRKW